MAIFKCKMCGGALEINENITVAECEYCGSKQTVPSKKDEVVTNLFNRANNLRLKNEFDKAAEIYNKILNGNDADAEAHWGLVLCKYGIEYVEDPKTYKRIPTCHRTQYTSVLSDADYLAAVENADAVSKEVYSAEAKEIAELQKSILAIVKDEKPFDVFICYKETDENGKRTVDSTLANDIYYQLEKEGLRVFYAAITLEDKLGVEYEPYIFAALNSAKVMLAIGTKPEYFNAVWVKNEWSRYLGIMKTDREKMLIPCYRDMDAYDLPEEFAHLQAQDMSKIGFINDLVRGIKKVAVKDEPKAAETVVQQVVGATGNIQALLKRGNLALEDHEWDRADGFFEEVLNLDAECAEAYLGKLFAQVKVSSLDSYTEYLYRRHFGNGSAFEKKQKILTVEKNLEYKKIRKYSILGYIGIDEISSRYQSVKIKYNHYSVFVLNQVKEVQYELNNNLLDKAKRFATGELAGSLAAVEGKILTRAEEQRKNAVANNDEESKNAKVAFEEEIRKIDEYFDELYSKKIQEREKDYYDCCNQLESAGNIDAFRVLCDKFKGFGDFKESEDLVLHCTSEIKRLEAELAAKREKELAEKRAIEEAEKERKRIEEEKKRKARNKKMVVFASLAAVLAAVAAIVLTVVVPSVNYNKAIELMEAGNYKEAAIVFGKAGSYKDAEEKCNQAWQDIVDRKAIAAGRYLTVGLKGDGTVIIAGDEDYAGKDNWYSDDGVSLWTDIIAIAAGSTHTVGLRSDGTIVAEGWNYHGQCGVSHWKNIVAIATSDYSTVGLKKNGEVVSTTYDVSHWKDIVAVAGGGFHIVGLKEDGTVLAEGRNQEGQCNVKGWTDIVAIAAGEDFTVGCKSDGTVLAVGGENPCGQCDVDNWTDIIALAAGDQHVVGLKANGTVVAVGDNDYGQCDVSAWKDIVAISARDGNTVGLKSDGTVVVVGDNDSYQCYTSDWKNIKTP